MRSITSSKSFSLLHPDGYLWSVHPYEPWTVDKPVQEHRASDEGPQKCLTNSGSAVLTGWDFRGSKRHSRHNTRGKKIRLADNFKQALKHV